MFDGWCSKGADGPVHGAAALVASDRRVARRSPGHGIAAFGDLAAGQNVWGATRAPAGLVACKEGGALCLGPLASSRKVRGRMEEGGNPTSSSKRLSPDCFAGNVAKGARTPVVEWQASASAWAVQGRSGLLSDTPGRVSTTCRGGGGQSQVVPAGSGVPDVSGSLE